MGRYSYTEVAAIEARGRRAAPVRDRFGAERETILRAQRFEVEAIEALFDDHFDGLYRYCSSLTGDAAAAEDLARRTWSRALEGLPRYRRFEAGFGTWLERIANSLLKTAPGPSGDGPQDRVRAALRRLTPEQLDVLALRLVAGLPSEEIARATGRGRMRVEALLHRALLAMREPDQAPEPVPAAEAE